MLSFFFLIIGFYIPKNLGAMNMKVAVIGLGKTSLIQALGLWSMKSEDADVVFDSFDLRFGREERCATEIRPSELLSQPLMKSC